MNDRREYFDRTDAESALEVVAAKLAKLEAELVEEREELVEWAHYAELARTRLDKPEELRKGTLKTYRDKIDLLRSGERLRAYLMVELDLLSRKVESLAYLN